MFLQLALLISLAPSFASEQAATIALPPGSKLNFTQDLLLPAGDKSLAYKTENFACYFRFKKAASHDRWMQHGTSVTVTKSHVNFVKNVYGKCLRTEDPCYMWTCPRCVEWEWVDSIYDYGFNLKDPTVKDAGCLMRCRSGTECRPTVAHFESIFPQVSVEVNKNSQPGRRGD